MAAEAGGDTEEEDEGVEEGALGWVDMMVGKGGGARAEALVEGDWIGK